MTATIDPKIHRSGSAPPLGDDALATKLTARRPASPASPASPLSVESSVPDVAAPRAHVPGALAARAVSAPTVRRHWAPKPSGEADPAAHLTPEQIDAFGAVLDRIREEVLASRGADDAAYIRRVIDIQRKLEAGSRIILLFSGNPVAWLVGTAGLSLAKILENMEIGHNVMHGQWDWMKDPRIHSRSWEWDNTTPSRLWKHSHNELHHTYTNVLGRDNDLGFGILRVDPDQSWEPSHLLQPLFNALNAVFFQYTIALYDLDLYKHFGGDATDEDRERLRRDGGEVVRKIARHVFRDYVVHPALSGPNWFTTVTANAVADLARNLWTNAVIICGHFPEGVDTFAKESIEGESRGEWYLRQGLGSANISGGPLLHVMTGNLSHQIEHHMFPDLPSNRYADVAPAVRELMTVNGLHYASGPMPKQLASVWFKVFRYSVPNGTWEQLRDDPRGVLTRGAGAVTGGARSVAKGAARALVTRLRRAVPALV